MPSLHAPHRSCVVGCASWHLPLFTHEHTSLGMRLRAVEYAQDSACVPFGMAEERSHVCLNLYPDPPLIYVVSLIYILRSALTTLVPDVGLWLYRYRFMAEPHSTVEE